MVKIRLLIISMCMLVATTIQGQNNVASVFNPHSHLENAFLNPALVGYEYKDVKVSILPIYLNASNNFTGIGYALDFANMLNEKKEFGSAQNQTINGLMYGVKPNNQLYIGSDISLINIGVNINYHRKRFLELQLALRQHAQVQMSIPESLLQLIYQGNKYYENETVEILPKINALQYNDISLNISKEFKLKLSDSGKAILVKPALRLRYLMGNAHLSTQDAGLEFYTAPEGKSLSATMYGQIQQSLPSENSLSDLNFSSLSKMMFSGNGRGLGMDLGCMVTVSEKLQGGLGISDVGSITFTKNAYTFTSNQEVQWQGYDINQGIDTIFKENNFLKLDTTSEYYKVSLPSKFMLHAHYGLGKRIWFKRYLGHYHHNLTFVYLQGMKNYLNATKTPFVMVGYSYRYKNAFNIGLNAGLGGLQGAALGGHVHFGLGPIHLGFASNGWHTFMNKYKGKGLDLQVYTAFNF